MNTVRHHHAVSTARKLGVMPNWDAQELLRERVSPVAASERPLQNQVSVPVYYNPRKFDKLGETCAPQLVVLLDVLPVVGAVPFAILGRRTASTWGS